LGELMLAGLMGVQIASSSVFIGEAGNTDEL